MRVFKHLTLLYFFILSISTNSFAQSELWKESKVMLYDTSESTRNSAQVRVAKIVDSLLQVPSGWDYPLDTIRFISALRASDDAFRIITWNVPQEDGTYRFFGRVRLKNNGKTAGKTVVLTDASASITKAGSKQIGSEEWFGALYYQIIKTKYKKSIYYTLLGWDGNTAFSNKKLVDVMLINTDGTVKFGAPIFDDGKRTRHRFFFEHAERAVMSLKYQEKTGLIIFDHLAPSQPSLEGQYEFYAPDFTTDAFKFEKGKWVYIKNYEARNEDEVQPINRKKPERGLTPQKQ
jgi:hypothetical protein